MGRPSWRGGWVVAGWAFVVVSLASFLGCIDPWFDGFAHARLYESMGGAVLLFGALLVRVGRWLSSLLVLAVLAHAVSIAGLFVGARTAPIGESFLRIVLFNAQVENPQKQEVAEWIEREAFDLVVLQEATDDLCDRVDASGAYRRVVADLLPGVDAKRSSAIHLRVASAIEVEGVSVHRVDDPSYRLALLEARLKRGATSFVVFTPRMPTPFTTDRREVRRRMIETLIVRANAERGAGRSVLVVADLNTTPFAHEFRDLLERADLRDTAAGAGYTPTWRGSGWLAAIGLPIDHVLTSPEFQVVKRRVFEDRLGSDHHPVIVELGLAARSPSRSGG